MATDAELMEASLVALADTGIEIRHVLFERFFAAFPERRASFYNLEVSSRRMTDETLQMMFGLAGEEQWVRPLVAELVFTHRNYGPLPFEEYEAFIDMSFEEIGRAAPAGWSVECAAAWARQAGRLKAMIFDMRNEWTRVMPDAKAVSAV